MDGGYYTQESFSPQTRQKNSIMKIQKNTNSFISNYVQSRKHLREKKDLRLNSIRSVGMIKELKKNMNETFAINKMNKSVIKLNSSMSIEKNMLESRPHRVHKQSLDKFAVYT